MSHTKRTYKVHALVRKPDDTTVALDVSGIESLAAVQEILVSFEERHQGEVIACTFSNLPAVDKVMRRNRSPFHPL